MNRLAHLSCALVRKLIAPWLRFQSFFNLSAVSVLEQVEQRVRALEDAERTLRQTVETLEKTLLRCTDHDLAAPIESLEDAFLLRINDELGRQGSIGQAGLWFEPPVQIQLDRDGPRIARVNECILEQIFVHTHLPPPPARLLSLGCSGSTNAIEMAGLGFEVVGVDARPMPLQHPNFTLIQTPLVELPFDDHSFDGCVALSTLQHIGLNGSAAVEGGVSDELAMTEVFRVLKSGARFILTVPFGRRTVTPAQRIYDRPQLDRLLQDFRVLERGYGVHKDDAWSFTRDEPRVESAEGERHQAVCLLVLEKP